MLAAGGAVGPDTWTQNFATERGWPFKLFPAEWGTYARRAGVIRNNQMADYADVLLAFWNKRSPGTRNMIDCMMKRGKWIRVILDE